MKEEAAGPDEQVAKEADEKDGIMTIFAAGLDTEIGKVDKEEIGEGIHYLGGGFRRVVVLTELSVVSMELFAGGFCGLLRTS